MLIYIIMIQIFNKREDKEEKMVRLKRSIHLNKWRDEEVRKWGRGDCEDKKEYWWGKMSLAQ